MDRGAWQATVHVVTRVGHNLATKPPPIEQVAQFCHVQDLHSGPLEKATNLSALFWLLFRDFEEFSFKTILKFLNN